MRFFAGKNFATVLPFGYPTKLHANDTAWDQRDLELVYVKTGVNPEGIREPWGELPKMMRDVLEEASAAALAGQEETIGQIVANAYAARQIHFGERLTLFLRSCQYVDAYVRAVRADRMARQVMCHGGHLFGDWPHLDKANTRAVLHGALPATELDKLYARSRILMNTAPCTLTGIHERVLAAFQAKAFMLADGSPFLDTVLDDYPSFKSVPFNAPECANAFDVRIFEIRGTGKDTLATRDMLENAQRKAEEAFGLDRVISTMLEFVPLNKVEAESAFYAR